MFSAEDVRDILQLFPPPTSKLGIPALLVPASSGIGLVTVEQLQFDFKRRVTQGEFHVHSLRNTSNMLPETKRIPISTLARDLDVSEGIVYQLLRENRPLALVTKNNKDIISKPAIDELIEEVRKRLELGIVLEDDFDSKHDVNFKDLRTFLGDEEPRIFFRADHVLTATFEEALRTQALNIVKLVRDGKTNVDLGPTDLEELSGSPPQWLFQRYLESVVESAEFEHDVCIIEVPDVIRVQSRYLREIMIDDWARPLQSGEVAYVDLGEIFESGRVVFDSIDDVVRDFKTVDTEVLDTFAISKTWISNLVRQKLQESKETGAVDVAKNLGEKFSQNSRGHKSFPKSLYGDIERMVEEHLISVLSQNPDSTHHRFGTIVLTNTQHLAERATLLERSAASATEQWHLFTSSPTQDLKYSPPQLTHPSPIQLSIHPFLYKDKALQKQCEDAFWTSIASQESVTDAAFATFWTDRVVARLALYNLGLTSISDVKLHDQLSDLLATYTHSELLPDTLAKARTQNLLLSRKTRKNVAKLESTLSSSSSTPDLATLTSQIDRFTSKQVISPPSASALAAHKASMVSDMQRRMPKHVSNGPVLFLTLVVVLCARHYEGAVYATGKYAPRLMKMLRGKVGEVEFERLEAWKEGVRAGKLGERDAAGMVGMAVEGEVTAEGEEVVGSKN
jgi:hypothetical protein